MQAASKFSGKIENIVKPISNETVPDVAPPLEDVLFDVAHLAPATVMDPEERSCDLSVDATQASDVDGVSVPSEAVVELVEVASVAPALLEALGLRELLALRATCSAMISTARAAMITQLVLVAASQYKERNVDAALPKAATAAQCFRLLGAVANAGDRKAATLAAAIINGQSGPADARSAATRVLVRVGSDPGRLNNAVTSLLRAMSDPNRCVSAAAARAIPKLVAHGDASVIGAATKRLGHKFSGTRQAALTLLAEIAPRGDTELVTAVTKLARGDDDWCVRAAALRSLPQLAGRGDDMAYCAVLAAMKDSQPAVRRVAAGAVVHLAERPSAVFMPSTPTRRRPKRTLSLTISDPPHPQSPRSRRIATAVNATTFSKRTRRPESQASRSAVDLLLRSCNEEVL